MGCGKGVKSSIYMVIYGRYLSLQQGSGKGNSLANNLETTDRWEFVLSGTRGAVSNLVVTGTYAPFVEGIM